MDINEFLESKRPTWLKLEDTLHEVETKGIRTLDVERVREFGRLYRAVTSDLILAQTRTANVQILDYLNDLVGRSYAQIYSGQRLRLSRLYTFLFRDYPGAFRREAYIVALASAIFFAGSLFGFVAMAVDSDAGVYLLPKQHLHLDPGERVEELESTGEPMSAEDQGLFSSYLFTHNIQVTFAVFALGITFGIGTVILMFLNGLSLGSLAFAYHQKGVAVFFYSWIMPHGVPELFSIFIAGAAGLLIGRALMSPGRLRRGVAARDAAYRAVKLVIGTMMILVVAGIIEGTISQLHEPLIPYEVKRFFAYVVGTLLLLFFTLAGNREPSPIRLYRNLAILFTACSSLEVVLLVHQEGFGQASATDIGAAWPMLLCLVLVALFTLLATRHRMARKNSDGKGYDVLSQGSSP